MKMLKNNQRLHDAQGLEVTTDSMEAIAAIDQFVDQLLSHTHNSGIIFEGVKAYPACIIANTHAAVSHLLTETAEAPTQAAPYLNAAREHLAQASLREQLYFLAINAWATGDIDQAVTYHEEIANKFPRDLASVKIGQYHYLNLGNSQGLLQIAEKVFPNNQENHYIYGMLAMGLEECHRLEDAEVAGRQAVAMNRYDIWAHHATAHVFETQGRLNEGITWMESLADVWEECRSPLYTHNWWHIALYYIEKKDYRKVLEVYDTRIWKHIIPGFLPDAIGAISLLIRLELRAVDVGEPMKEWLNQRWSDVASSVGERIHEHIVPLNDLHYIYALARTGQNHLVAQLLNSIQAQAQAAKPYIQSTWREVVILVAQGLVAYVKGDWVSAIAKLEVAFPRLHEVGGSHAQRDVFEQVYLDALIRAQTNHQVRELLEKRAATRRSISIY